ncbi:MAG: Gfo/Idh/MocA family oxidoreductase [Phycisphaerae bacterium]|jgi:predicted dehydrogenase
MSITVGVIGCGGISRFHFSGLGKAGAKIKWVCDIAEAKAAPWAKQFGAQYTADYRQIIADKEVNVVDVTAISSIHKEVCLAAIAAGKAVICEKTLAENVDDALDIVQAATRKGTIFYTSYMKRFIPAMEKAKQLLPSLGRIISTNIRAYQHWGNLWDAAPTEGLFSVPAGGRSIIKACYGGGILVCGGSHILDLVVFFLGRPTRLFASMHTTPGMDLDLQAAALMQTPNGVVHYEALAHPLSKIGFLRDGWDERIEINGVGGRLEVFSSAWDQVESKASLLVHYDNATGAATEYRYEPASPFDRAMAFFCKNIEAGRQGDQSPATGYDVDNLIQAIQASAASGQTVALEYKV